MGTLPDGYHKIGNRIYHKEDVDGTEMVIKHTEDTEASDNLREECGRWTTADFLAHAETYDQNTEDEYSNIVSTLSLS